MFSGYTIDWIIDISHITFQVGGLEQQIVIMAGYLNYLRSQFSIHRNHVDQRCIILYCISSRKLYKGTNEIISFYPTNLNTLYLLLLFYSVIEIMTVRSRPVICTLIGWVKSSCLFTSLSGFCGKYLKVRTAGIVCTSNTMTMVENIVWIPGILHSLKF